MGNLLSLKLASTKLTNQRMMDLTSIYRCQTMKLKELDLSGNQITSAGFKTLMNCLKASNKVKKLNLSRNNICSDINQFKIIMKFLASNKILEELNLSKCDLDAEAAMLIGRGLRGNMNLQTLILKQNEIGQGVSEIAQAFDLNKRGLCLKNLDLSKCELDDKHITEQFLQMLSSPYSTLKNLNLRDNLIQYEGSGKILLAIENNRTIIKLCLAQNPIKTEVFEKIAKICDRNKSIDAIQQKNKNLAVLKQIQTRSNTNKQALKTEIKDLKSKTDKTLDEAQSSLLATATGKDDIVSGYFRSGEPSPYFS